MSRQNKPEKKSAKKNNNRLRFESDKYLVTEQSGKKVLLVGLFLSFFLGKTITSVFSPSRVSAEIQKAASHIHKDINIKFKDAFLSLSDGFLPRFSVVIKEVSLESKEDCWMAPDLQVDELRLPISVWGWITGGTIIEKIEADQIDLNLRGNTNDCKKLGVSQTNTVAMQAPVIKLSSGSEKLTPQKIVKEMTVNNLRITVADHSQYPLELSDFKLKMKSFDPKIIEIAAKTHLFHDEQVGGYLSYANLYAEYSESSEPQIKSHFFGNWREGHYSFIANYTIADHFLKVESELKHIPLSQILGALQKYNLVSKEINGRQVWVSATAQLASDVQKLKNSSLEIRNFEVEGDLGEIAAQEVTFTNLEPLIYKPIIFDVKKMPIEKLMLFLNRKEDRKIFGDLGVFSGQAEIRAENSILLKGEHNGLEFIFSNKGERESQFIESMLGEAILDGDKWYFIVNQVQPEEGLFVGHVRVTTDRDFDEVNLTAKIDELSLAPRVQKLMTQDGHVGPVMLNAEGQVLKGRLNQLKGLVSINGLKLEGMDFGQTYGSFFLRDNSVVMNTKVHSLIVGPKSAGAIVMKQMIEPNLWGANGLEIRDINGQFSWDKITHLQWHNFHGKLQQEQKILADGQWDEKGQLSGTAVIKVGRLSKNYLLTGQREKPILSEEINSGIKKIIKQ